MGTSFILKSSIHNFNFWTYYQYLSIFNAIIVVGYFKLILVLTRPCKNSSFVNGVAKLSFGIYLIHMLVLYFLKHQVTVLLSINNYVLQSLALDCVTFIVSAICAYLISLTPASSLLIGIKRQKG